MSNSVPFSILLIINTRQSSCVNARGIPTAAYQYSHVLSCPGRVSQVSPSHPDLAGGTPGGGPWLGYPPSWPGLRGGTLGWAPPGWVPPGPDLAGGYPLAGTPLLGYPPILTYPGQVPPGWGTPLAGPDWSTPLPARWGTPQLDLASTPHTGPGGVLNPPPPCGQTDGWMDRHVWKHYLPVILRTRSVNI